MTDLAGFDLIQRFDDEVMRRVSRGELDFDELRDALNDLIKRAVRVGMKATFEYELSLFLDNFADEHTNDIEPGDIKDWLSDFYY